MKKIFMLGVFMFSMMTFTISVHATDVNNINDMAGVIQGSTIDGNKITLTQDVNLEENYLNIISGTYVIDLNGKTLFGSNNMVIYINGDNASLTINDTSSSKIGKIICTKETSEFSQTGVHLKNGLLTINGGTFESEDYGAFIEDTATINGGIFLGVVGAKSLENSNITINNGNFGNDDNGAGSVFDGNIVINNGVFKGSTALAYHGTTMEDTLTINDGTFGNENTEIGLFLMSGTAIIKGGKINAGEEYGYGIYASTEISETIDLTIDDVKITGNIAGLYALSEENNENNSLKINGGIFSSKETGLAVSENMIPYTEITGGRFIATNTDENENYGGVAIILEVSGNNPMNLPYTSSYTLNSLLKPGYNYSNRTFSEKTIADDYEDYNTETKISKTAKDVFVAQEKTITIKNGIVNGTVTSQEKAIVGEEVILTVTPANGYILKTISALDKFDEMSVTITNNKFVMPDYNVFIGAEFEIDYSFFEESKGKTYTINKDDKLVFKLKPNYNLFETGGKVYLDDKVVDQKYITSKSGSTIITLSKEYLDKLSIGNHTLKVTFNTDVSAETMFTIDKGELNPQTGDGIMISIIIGSISLIGLLGTSLYLKKKRFN